MRPLGAPADGAVDATGGATRVSFEGTFDTMFDDTPGDTAAQLAMLAGC